MAAAKYQVFISSTYEDLKNERDEVVRAVLEMGHIPVGMEMFSAADEEQWKIIARHIDESDYYVCIVAHRYGSVTEEGISYTRKEYEYSLSQGVPILGFIIDEAAAWPTDRVDKGDDKNLLDSFKAKVREKPVGPKGWTSADDLHGKVVIALMKAITASPRQGWIRGGEGAGPQVMAELSRLSAENASLRQSLQSTATKAEADSREEMTKVLEMLRARKHDISIKYTGRDAEWEDIGEATLYWLFGLLAPEMYVEKTVNSIGIFVALNSNPDDSRTVRFIPSNSSRSILSDLMTLGLVEPSTKKHPVADTNEYWRLSDFGRQTWKMINQESLTSSAAKAARVAKPTKKATKKAPAKAATKTARKGTKQK